uniref:Uncharacterized protein n=1 Tax=Fagus sylvatica TaxID=28930 RepID=A0A2N9GLG3_FAGSY
MDRESLSEDFVKLRPKSKRIRGYDTTLALAHKATDLSIEVLKGNGKLIPQVTKLWVERYEKGPEPVMSCGAKYHIKEGVLGEISVKDVLIALESLAVTGVEDYQNSEGKKFKNFKDNLESFWDNLVRECQHGPLFDQVLFKECMAYIIPLSCTPTTVYRQVASMIGLQLVTSFIAIAKMLSAQCEATRRQLDAEKEKRTEGPCLESPNKSKYVKYLGWALNDKNAGVRRASILALQNLYELHGNLPIMSEFSAKYSKRMIDLTEDIDVSVAVCAIRFVNQLLRQQIISDTTVALDLLELATDDPPQIRRAIGELFYDYVIGQKLYTSQSGTIVECSPSPEVHLIKMLRMLEAFSTDPILRIYLIDDAWEYMEAMKDWECIISLLLDENPLIEFLDDGATKLLWLLCASVRKAVGERILPATNNCKQYYTKAQKKGITVAMMENYPLLLHKFMADKGKVSSLVEIVLHTNLGLYSSMRQEESFKSVLQLMRVAFFTHGEKEALRSCARAIDFCSTKSKGELQGLASNEFKELEDELIAKLKAAIKEVVDGGDGYSLLENLKRLYELQLLRAVSIESLYEDMVMVLSSFRNMEDEVCQM